MTDKYTPGPWTAGEFQSNGMVNQTPINPVIGVAYGDKNESTANARLIAAAPDLLAALEETLQALIDMLLDRDYTEESVSQDPAVIKARAAIAKARGE